MRNLFTPAMKLIEKKRMGSKVSKTYDSAQTPCDRMLACEHGSEQTKEKLRAKRAATAGGGCVTALIASAPAAFTAPPPAEVLAKVTNKSHKPNQVRVS